MLFLLSFSAEKGHDFAQFIKKITNHLAMTKTLWKHLSERHYKELHTHGSRGYCLVLCVYDTRGNKSLQRAEG